MIHLPQFTFLNGPNGSGKTSISNALAEQDSGLCQCSFASPIRLALLSVFHPDKMFDDSLDLREERVKSRLIYGTNRTHREWMIEFGKWMKSYFNPYIFASIAHQNCERLMSHWNRFIFDDCRFPEEISPFSLGHGADSCLIITISRDGCDWHNPLEIGQSLLLTPGADHVALSNNSTIPDALAQLFTILSPKGYAHASRRRT